MRQFISVDTYIKILLTVVNILFVVVFATAFATAVEWLFPTISDVKLAVGMFGATALTGLVLLLWWGATR